jgi:hypothetical protein
MASFDFDDDKIFFNYDFNEELNPNYIKFISKFTSLYFSDYADVKLAIETNNEHQTTSNPDYIFTYIGSKFNKQIDGKLLEGLDKIHFGCCFNQSVTNLPNSITELIFGQNFNKPINNLPPKLFRLELGKYFSHPVDNLPNNLKILKFDNSSEFINPLDNLPNSLTILKIGYEYNLGLDNLPNSLVALEISGKFNKPINNLPDSIEILHLDIKTNEKIIKLPQKLTHIYFGLSFCNLNQINFSSLINLKNIQYHSYCNYNKPIKNLPDSIEKIYLPKYYSKLFNQKCKNLIHLELSKNYKHLDKVKKIYSDSIIHFVD